MPAPQRKKPHKIRKIGKLRLIELPLVGELFDLPKFKVPLFLAKWEVPILKIHGASFVAEEDLEKAFREKTGKGNTNYSDETEALRAPPEQNAFYHTEKNTRARKK